MSILEIKTSGTTVYYVDTEAKKFLRVKGATSSSDLWFDGDWNGYYNDPVIEVGESLKFILTRPVGAWSASTAVVSIREVPAEEVPVAKSEQEPTEA